MGGEGQELRRGEGQTSRGEDSRSQPKGEPLTPGQVEKVRQWIAEGAIWPENGADRAAPRDPHLAHRAYTPVRRPAQGSKIDEPSESGTQDRGVRRGSFSPIA